MNRQVFTVYGEPKGKARPRFRGHAYTDRRTEEYEARVRLMWRRGSYEKLKRIPTAIVIDAYFSVPKSLPKKRRAEMFGSLCLKRPDADNIAKIILDALNKLAYEDDAQISTLCVTKRYVRSDDEEPRVTVTILGGRHDGSD